MGLSGIAPLENGSPRSLNLNGTLGNSGASKSNESLFPEETKQIPGRQSRFSPGKFSIHAAVAPLSNCFYGRNTNGSPDNLKTEKLDDQF